MKPAPIFFVSGTPGSGKTSFSRALLAHFEFGLHLPIDDLREFVISGIAHPINPTIETTRQFRLARVAAMQTAKLYALEGFAIAIDDVLFPNDVTKLEQEFLTDFKVHKILLRPRLEIALFRNASRTNKDFDTAILEPVIRDLYANMNPEEFHNAGWTVFDSSDLNLETTVCLILEKNKI
jgi:tRNA uridine 5-carbamoylmethylation protein Kti12